MDKFYLFFCLQLCLISASLNAYEINDRPKNFKLLGHNGKEHSLQQYAGKIIVLEWYNFACPFVRKHYDTGNMQKIQKKFTKKGVIWLSITSSARGKQGYFANSFKAYQIKLKEKSFATAILMDVNGRVGRDFNARTTPEFFIINKLGVLVYKGAVDNIATSNKSDIPRARNYVDSALAKLSKDLPIGPSKTRPYGCSIKY